MQLAVLYETVDTSQSARIYEEAIRFARNKKLPFETANLYFNRSFLFQAAGKYDEALHSLDTALFFIDQSSHPNTAFKKAQIVSQLASVYKELNQYEISIEYHLQSNQLFEEINRPAGLITSLLNTAVLYKELQDYTRQEFYARKALSIARKTQNKDDLLIAYTYVAHALSEQDKVKDAKVYIDSAALYINNYHQNQPIALLNYYLIRGSIFLQLNKLDSSFQSFKKAYDLSQNQSAFGRYQSLLQMGNVRRKEKKFDEAEKYLLEALEGINKTGELAQKNIAFQYLADLYEDRGDTKKALEYYKKYKSISDSVASLKNKNLATSLEKKYESEKKEATIKWQQKQLENQKRLIYMLGITALLFATILLLSYRTYRQKQKIQQQRINELETEKELSAIKAVLKGEEQERTRLAKDLHDGLSGMLSGIKYTLQNIKGNLIMNPENQQALERSIDMLDNSIKEMRRIAHNMMPEVLVRYGLDTALKDYATEINKTGIIKVIYQSMEMEDKDMDQTTAITVFRIVQELLNNVIKHAQATEVLVQVFRQMSKLVINVEDNGKGFDVTLSKEMGGMGWKNIYSRVEMLKGSIDVHSAPDKGTFVSLELNIE
ncbi:tetratricopeptide repeat-containing sensor histidine kinase [Thermoflavifilum aggregans]|nr:tetratricopeptide repeat protein [Thermoflavifilum aggregans]